MIPKTAETYSKALFKGHGKENLTLIAVFLTCSIPLTYTYTLSSVDQIPHRKPNWVLLPLPEARTKATQLKKYIMQTVKATLCNLLSSPSFLLCDNLGKVSHS